VARLAAADSKAAIFIVPADEERIVARATAELLAGARAQSGEHHGR